ncbi:MAG: hypothetical protein ACLRP4_00055 [Dialister invisus]
MKNNGVKNEHKINTCRRTDQLWLFPSLHFMIFVMPAMFGSIFLMSGYIAVMFLEQIGTAIICTALMFRHLFAMSAGGKRLLSGSFIGFHPSFPCLSEIRGCHCRAAILLLHHLLSWVDDQTSLYRETLAFGKKSSFPDSRCS